MKMSAVAASLAILIAFPTLLSAQRMGVTVVLGPGNSSIGLSQAGVGQSDAGLARAIPPHPHWRRNAPIALGPSVPVPGPSANDVGPRHVPRTPTHPIATPGASVIAPRNLGIAPSRKRARRGVLYVPLIIQHGTGRVGSIHPTGQTFPPRIAVGTSRNEVIALLGRPKMQIVERHSETLIFGPTRIVIKNGFVAHVH